MVLSLQGVTISNDGATIMKLLEIVHPAAKTLVDISLSQDAEVCSIIKLAAAREHINAVACPRSSLFQVSTCVQQAAMSRLVTAQPLLSS